MSNNNRISIEHVNINIKDKTDTPMLPETKLQNLIPSPLKRCLLLKDVPHNFDMTKILKVLAFSLLLEKIFILNWSSYFKGVGILPFVRKDIYSKLVKLFSL